MRFAMKVVYLDVNIWCILSKIHKIRNINKFNFIMKIIMKNKYYSYIIVLKVKLYIK